MLPRTPSASRLADHREHSSSDEPDGGQATAFTHTPLHCQRRHSSMDRTSLAVLSLPCEWAIPAFPEQNALASLVIGFTEFIEELLSQMQTIAVRRRAPHLIAIRWRDKKSRKESIEMSGDP